MPVIATTFGNIEPLVLLGLPIVLLAVAALILARVRTGPDGRRDESETG